MGELIATGRSISAATKRLVFPTWSSGVALSGDVREAVG